MEALNPIAIAGALVAIAMLSVAVLRGWSQWLAYKHRELELSGAARTADMQPEMAATGARIELADLKERIRKLEAIAAGVDL